MSKSGKPSYHDELHLHLICALQYFEKLDVDCIGLINPTAKNSKDIYIITITEYLTRWAEAEVVQDCFMATIA